MANFPPSSDLFNPGLTGAAANALVKQWYDTTKQLPGALPPKTYIIMNDSITPDQESCVVDTEGGAQGDNLSVINTLNMQDGALVMLRRADVNRVVTLINSTAANGMRLYGNANKVLGVYESVTLRRAGNVWLEEVTEASLRVSIAQNAAAAAQGTANTAVQKADAAQATANQALVSVSPLETLFIGAPIYQPTTTLPANCMRPDGSLALFADWLQFAAKYRAGGFAGMVDNSSNSANLGKFVLNSNGTGLYLPRCGGQFMRNWGPGFGTAGAFTPDMGRSLTGGMDGNTGIHADTKNFYGAFYAGNSVGNHYAGTTPSGRLLGFDAQRVWGAAHIGSKFKPDSIDQPVAIFMGNHA